MGKFVDLTGQTFGRLSVLERADDHIVGSRKRTQWHCRCECGNLLTVLGDNLRGHKTQSCGCYQRERASATNTTHGDTNSHLYGVWCAMRNRCYNPSVPYFKRYGGRGITVCDEWRNSYDAFRSWAYDNGYIADQKRGVCTLDRKDNDGDYTPENCRWISQREQMSNVSYNHRIEYNGQEWTVAELARFYAIPYTLLYQRLYRYNLPIEKAIQM